MTELMQLYLQNREEAEKKIKEMDAARLLAELDDTVQFDMMKMSTEKYVKLPRDRTVIFTAIRYELYERLAAAERKERAGKA